MRAILKSPLYSDATFVAAGAPSGQASAVSEGMLSSHAGATVGKTIYRVAGAPIIRLIHDAVDPIPDDEEYKLVREARDRYYESTLL